MVQAPAAIGMQTLRYSCFYIPEDNFMIYPPSAATNDTSPKIALVASSYIAHSIHNPVVITIIMPIYISLVTIPTMVFMRVGRHHKAACIVPYQITCVRICTSERGVHVCMRVCMCACTCAFVPARYLGHYGPIERSVDSKHTYHVV